MASYPKEVQERIRALEKEIEDIKKDAALCSVVDSELCRELSKISGLYYDNYSTRISYICRAACTGSVPTKRGCKNSRGVRGVNELSKQEAELSHKCASEVLEILIKYAKETADGLDTPWHQHPR